MPAHLGCQIDPSIRHYLGEAPHGFAYFNRTKGNTMGLGLIASIIVGGLAGWIASMIMKADTGILLNIVLGIVGAVVLNAVLGIFGIYAANSWIPQLIVGAAGASALIWLYRRVKS